DGAEDEDEFGDFDTFSNVPHSISFTEFETPATFNQNEAFSTTSPPELLNSRGLTAFSHSSSNGTHSELSKANGVVPGSHLGPSERTEIKKVLSGPVDFSVSDSAPAGCNGGGSEVLTNGFATFDVQGSPSSQDSAHSCKKATSTEDTGSVPAEDDFADFAAFSNAEGHGSQTASEDSDGPPGGSSLAEAACHEEHCDVEQDNASEDRDTDRTGPDTCGSDSGPAEALDGWCNTDRGPHSDSGPAEAPDGSCNTDRGPHSDSGPAEAPDGSCNTDRGPHSDSGPVRPRTARATRTGAPTLTLVPLRLRRAGATRTGAPTLTLVPLRPQTARATRTGAPTLTLVPLRLRRAGATRTGAPTLTLVPLRLRTARATRTGAPTLTLVPLRLRRAVQHGPGPHSDSGPAEAPTARATRTGAPTLTLAPDGSCNMDRGPHSDSGPAEAPDGLCNTARGPHSDSEQRDVAFAQEASEAVCTNRPLTLNGVDVADGDDSRDGGSEDDADEGQSDGKGSGNETETSLGRPLSTEALEEFGDISTTGSVPSPPLQGETAATPADYSRLAEDDDEDYGDFGDAGSFSGQGFADFEQLDVQPEPSRTESPAPAQEATEVEEEDDFGDFNSPKFHASGTVGRRMEASLQTSPSATVLVTSAWLQKPQTGRRTQESRTEEEEWHESEVPAVSEETSSTDRQALCIRLEKLFQGSFPQAAAPPVEDQVTSLKNLLEPEENHQPGGEEKEKRSPCSRSVQGDVWSQLQDIHESFGPQIPVGGLLLQQSTTLLPGHRHPQYSVHGTEEAAGHRAHVRRQPGDAGTHQRAREARLCSGDDHLDSPDPSPAPETKTSCPAAQPRRRRSPPSSLTGAAVALPTLWM
ncbi:hypothetical protein KUCAC02_015806, partial [Chaenocephalus aceratus]